MTRLHGVIIFTAVNRIDYLLWTNGNFVESDDTETCFSALKYLLNGITLMDFDRTTDETRFVLHGNEIMSSQKRI